MDKLRNLSIRKTIFVYLLICLICSFFLSAIIVRTATYTQNRIWTKYTDMPSDFDAISGKVSSYVVSFERPDNGVLSGMDRSISELCDFLETYSILFVSVIGSCAAIFLFYRHKLKTPLEQLEKASKRIAENDLDFQITYRNQDEMGQLCAEFERMRRQLVENNQILWKNLDDEKILRSAIAHDIRSPLSVLKGYQEMLLAYIPDGTITTGNALEMLAEGMKQIERMDLFIETMRKMNSLEGRLLKAQEISSLDLGKDIQSEVNILFGKSEKKIVLDMDRTDGKFVCDKEIVLEVMENIISNALRYAKKQIEIIMRVSGEELRICVMDDGNGFDEDWDKITEAFHQKNVKDSLEHTGIGMYISRIYCEKHNGKLILENNKYGGAMVTAIFGWIV